MISGRELQEASCKKQVILKTEFPMFRRNIFEILISELIWLLVVYDLFLPSFSVGDERSGAS
jgi:hypothetical protein